MPPLPQRAPAARPTPPPPPPRVSYTSAARPCREARVAQYTPPGDHPLSRPVEVRIAQHAPRPRPLSRSSVVVKKGTVELVEQVARAPQLGDVRVERAAAECDVVVLLEQVADLEKEDTCGRVRIRPP